jgi:hypothetical protein
MRRAIAVVALAVAIAIVAPAIADTEVNSCSTTSAATVSPVIGETAPERTFEFTCTGSVAGCAFLVTLDSNGTGLVAGTLSAEVVSLTGEATFVNVETGKEAPDPSCDAAFQCHYATSEENPVVLFPTGGGTEGVAAKLTCTGGDISALETVGCNSVSVEFEAR